MFPLYDINPTRRTAWITYGIILANLVVLLWSLSLPPGKYDVIVAQRGFVPARIGQLRDPRKVVQVEVGTVLVRNWVGQVVRQPRYVNPPADPREILLSLLTCMFLHSGWMHYLGNMWFLFIFGDNIEDRFGHFPYLAFYLIGGLAASAVHWASDPSSTAPVIGASGAIAAVLGAYAVAFPRTRVVTLIFLVIYFTVIELPALWVLGFWFLAQLVDGVGVLRLHVSGGVAFWAHVGGFAFGAGVMALVRPLLPPIEPPDDLVDHRTDPAAGHLPYDPSW